MGLSAENRGPGLLDPGNFNQFGDRVENPGLQWRELFLGIRRIFWVWQDQCRTPQVIVTLFIRFVLGVEDFGQSLDLRIIHPVESPDCHHRLKFVMINIRFKFPKTAALCDRTVLSQSIGQLSGVLTGTGQIIRSGFGEFFLKTRFLSIEAATPQWDRRFSREGGDLQGVFLLDIHKCKINPRVQILGDTVSLLANNLVGIC